MAENLISGIIPKIGEVSEWSKELPWKGSIPITGIEGSNPSFSEFQIFPISLEEYLHILLVDHGSKFEIREMVKV